MGEKVAIFSEGKHSIKVCDGLKYNMFCHIYIWASVSYDPLWGGKTHDLHSWPRHDATEQNPTHFIIKVSCWCCRSSDFKHIYTHTLLHSLSPAVYVCVYIHTRSRSGECSWRLHSVLQPDPSNFSHFMTVWQMQKPLGDAVQPSATCSPGVKIFWKILMQEHKIFPCVMNQQHYMKYA